MKPFVIQGHKFGRLKALEPTEKRAPAGRIIWKCQCDCGNICYVSRNNLVGKDTRSCGCLQPKKSRLTKEEMILMVLEGKTYQHIANKANVTRQRIQQIVSPPPEIKKYIYNKYEGRCCSCGISLSSTKAHVHHKNDPSIIIENYNDIDNLELLCISCHLKIHHEAKNVTHSKCAQ